MQENGDVFEVQLVFDGNGQLVDVQPGTDTKGYTVETVNSLQGRNLFSASTVLYGHGSPGYTIYRTSAGYKIVYKPQ